MIIIYRTNIYSTCICLERTRTISIATYRTARNEFNSIDEDHLHILGQSAVNPVVRLRRFHVFASRRRTCTPGREWVSEQWQ